MKWEYMYVTIDFTKDEDSYRVEYRGEKVCRIVGSPSFYVEKLDEFGAQGWESSLFLSSGAILFKRAL